MTRASQPPRIYHGHRAGPLPGLAGWYTVPGLGVHFRIDGPGESPAQRGLAPAGRNIPGRAVGTGRLRPAAALVP